MSDIRAIDDHEPKDEHAQGVLKSLALNYAIPDEFVTTARTLDPARRRNLLVRHSVRNEP
jgi:hypothetical protein